MWANKNSASHKVCGISVYIQPRCAAVFSQFDIIIVVLL